MLVWLAAAALLASPLDGFHDEAMRQCPGRPVADLRPSDLRSRLEAFEASLPPTARTEMDQTRSVTCSAPHAYADSCENAADVDVLTRQGRLQEAVAFICGTVL